MKLFWKPNIELQSVAELTSSTLYNENTFYTKFINDLNSAREEVIIESPYITKRKLDLLKPTFNRLISRGVRVFIVTKSPEEHDRFMAKEAEEGIQYIESIGIQVLLIKGGHHRKLGSGSI